MVCHTMQWSKRTKYSAIVFLFIQSRNGYESRINLESKHNIKNRNQSFPEIPTPGQHTSVFLDYNWSKTNKNQMTKS